jgi:eukaryotic-like serine/threonine-protein kinase
MIPEAGQRLGPYEVRGWLAGGGMAGVFRAWDDRLHREVAIKLIRDRAGMPEMRERLMREARLVSGLTHPNICTIFDIGEQDGELYLVLELLEGETLRERIAAGPVPLEEMVRIAREVADALALAHSRGVVHRDIKPANIFLVNQPSGGKQAKVLDFGLAKRDLEGWGVAAGLTQEGATVGTISYMSPEQARGEELDARSDLFSLGVVLYEMATGQLPFTGHTSALVFLQLLSDDPPQAVRGWNAAIPKALERVIERLLEKQPEHRYASAEELVRELEGIGPERRPGWFRKYKPAVVLPRDPATRPTYPPRKAAAAKITTTWVDAEDSREVRTPHPAGMGGAAVARRELQERWPQVAPVGKPAAREGGATVALASDSSAGTMRSERKPEAVVRSGAALWAGEGNFWDDSSEILRASSEISRAAVVARPRRVADGGRRRSWWMVAAVATGLAGAALAWSWTDAAAPPVGSVLLLTRIASPPGEDGVAEAVLQGLTIDLAESDRFQVRGATVYEAGLRVVGGAGGSSLEATRKVAAWDGAQGFLAGVLQSTASGGYAVRMELVRTEGMHRQITLEATAESRDQVGEMVDRLAEQIRRAMGEPEESIRSAQVPLANEATGNVDALAAYFEGQRAELRGDGDGALKLYAQAATLEPRFAQAQRRLAVLDRERLAELQAARAAELGLAAANAASARGRMLAEFRAALDVDGDAAKGLRLMQQFVALHPQDAEGAAGLSEALRLDGRHAEALQAAQAAYVLDPLDVQTNAELERDLLVLDRYDAVSGIEARRRRLGLPEGQEVLLADYLGDRPSELGRLGAAQVGGVGYGVYLDNTGQLRAGEAVWRGAGRSSTASGVGSLAVAGQDLDGAPAAFLAQGALNRALVGVCVPASAMLHEALRAPHGTEASFEIGMAAALCGEPAVAGESLTALESGSPRNSAVWGFYVPDLKAVLAVESGDPQTALAAMEGSRWFEELSLTPYLRGVAEEALHQPALAAAQFQVVLAHRGAAVLGRSTVYPMAEIGLARALAETGDTAGSAAAYDRFLVLWKDADADPGPGAGLVQEARLRRR